LRQFQTQVQIQQLGLFVIVFVISFYLVVVSFIVSVGAFDLVVVAFAFVMMFAIVSVESHIRLVFAFSTNNKLFSVLKYLIYI